MPSRWRSVLLLTLWLSMCCTTATAGPWGKRWGEAYFKLAMTHFAAQGAVSQGLIAEDTAYRSWTASLYAAIGLPYRFTLIACLPYGVAKNIAPDRIFRNHDLGDATWELDYRVVERWPLSFGLELKTPLYTLAREQGDAGLVVLDGKLYNGASFPEFGDGNVDLTLKLMGGMALPWLSGWLQGALGYRKRFAAFVDGIYGEGQIGLYAWKRYVSLALYANGLVKLGSDANPTLLATRQFFYLEGQLGLGNLPGLRPLGVGISIGGVIVADNAATGSSVSVYLSYDLRQ